MEPDEFDFPADLNDPLEEGFQSSANESDAVAASVPFHVLLATPIEQLPRTVVPTVGTSSPSVAMRNQSVRGIGNSMRNLMARQQSKYPLRTFISAMRGSQLLTAEGTEVPAPVNHDDDTTSVGGGAMDGGPPSAARYTWAPKRARRLDWSEAESRDFFDALSQFGTDFNAIAVLFPGRERTEIKHKYHYELRKRPDAVYSALENRKEIDLEHFHACKRKCDALREAPIRKLNADEEEALRLIEEGTGDLASTAPMALVEPLTGVETSEFDMDLVETGLRVNDAGHGGAIDWELGAVPQAPVSGDSAMWGLSDPVRVVSHGAEPIRDELPRSEGRPAGSGGDFKPFSGATAPSGGNEADFGFDDVEGQLRGGLREAVAEPAPSSSQGGLLQLDAASDSIPIAVAALSTATVRGRKRKRSPELPVAAPGRQSEPGRAEASALPAEDAKQLDNLPIALAASMAAPSQSGRNPAITDAVALGGPEGTVVVELDDFGFSEEDHPAATVTHGSDTSRADTTAWDDRTDMHQPRAEDPAHAAEYGSTHNFVGGDSDDGSPLSRDLFDELLDPGSPDDGDSFFD